ncbi:hypothetical protein [Desulfogranum marinum]|uniref:hypothetical protein n=1 Tax=Desulfogranum marinum TaxID=453220 RepID=UPI0029C60F99|nr:hypothetical protein [Desulfogranum marinum]
MSTVLFILEAKKAPNVWEDIQTVYPQNEIFSLYSSKEEANAAKTKLKSLLSARWKEKFKKYPIRIRELDQ